MATKNKRRTEIVWNLEKDGDVVKYLEENIDNIGGFLKMLARDYVRSKVSYKYENSPTPSENTGTTSKPVDISEKQKATKNDNKSQEKIERKRLPFVKTAVSSKDLGLNME